MHELIISIFYFVCDFSALLLDWLWLCMSVRVSTQ